MLNLIIQRETSRQAKDFASADACRQQLKILGVEVFDKTSSWTASDGRAGRIPSFNDIQNGTAMSQLMSAGTAPLPGQDVYIKQLVQQREQARSSKDFDQSDRIRETLKGMGVEVYDKEKMWRSKDGQSGIIMGFFKSGPTDTEINTLVVQREKARQSNDFATSDMIRDALKEHGVEVYDKEKQWKAQDGRNGVVPQFGQALPKMGGSGFIGGMGGTGGMGGMGGMGGKGGMGAPSGADIQTQLMQAALECASNPGKAAQIMQRLQGAGAMGGGAGARAGPMKQAGNMGGMGAMGGGGANNAEAAEALNFISQCQAAGRPASDAEIEWLVTLREKIRQGKDFSSADAIRNGLRDQLGVNLQEKEKRWMCNDGRQGAIPMWS